MRKVGIVVAVVMTIASATGASAEAIYFHRPGVERDVFVADVTECEALAGAVQRPAQPSVYAPNLYAVAAASFFSGFFGSRERRGLTENVLRTCMADKGYRRVAADTDVRRSLAKLSPHDRVDRLFTLAAAPDPAGTVLPR